MPKKSLIELVIGLACCVSGAAAQGPVYKLLYSPPLGSNLGFPYGIFEGRPGLFYVLSTWAGGATGDSVFTVASNGTVGPIYSFPLNTLINVVQATNGDLYGGGSQATSPNYFYYSMGPSGKGLQEYFLTGTWGSAFNTTVAPPNAIYDLVARAVSDQTGYGFARISESGKIAILHEFSSNDGIPYPYSRMILGPDGNFYDVGAQQPHGISPMFILRLAPSGAYSRLLTFPQVPGYDAFPLVPASDGNLYGTFSKGGVNGTGVMYRATLSGQLQTLASFPATISSPRSLMQAADGNLYGTTVYNQIFRYNLATNAVTLVYQMDVQGSQGHCACILVEGTDGKLYGAAPNGGNYPGMGAVFSLDIGLPRPAPMVSGLYPSSGAVGQEVLLWGNYLLGATSVSFNGVPAASVRVTSVQSVAATVPVGAASGPVTITTPNGSFTTTTNFTVQ